VVVRHAFGRAAIENGQLAPAGPAGGQALEQGAALAHRPGAWLPGLGADIGPKHLDGKQDHRKLGPVQFPAGQRFNRRDLLQHRPRARRDLQPRTDGVGQRGPHVDHAARDRQVRVRSVQFASRAPPSPRNQL